MSRLHFNGQGRLCLGHQGEIIPVPRKRFWAEILDQDNWMPKSSDRRRVARLALWSLPAADPRRDQILERLRTLGKVPIVDRTDSDEQEDQS